MSRALAAWLLCLAALVIGVSTAALAADNRARGDELDRLERWCEAQSRRNELQRVENARAEWLLLGEVPVAEVVAGAARTAGDGAPSGRAKGAATP